jgi:hypothetical protein
MDTAASSQFQITSGTTQAFAIPASQAASVAARIVAGKASAAVHIGATAFLSVSVVSYGVPVPGQPASTGAVIVEVAAGTPGRRSRPGPWRCDRVARRARRHLSSNLPVGDRCVPSREQDQRGLGRPAGQAHTVTVVFAAGPAG